MQEKLKCLQIVWRLERTFGLTWKKDYCKQKGVEMASSSTLAADTGNGVVCFPVPKLSTGSISRQFIGPDETAIMARCLLRHELQI